MDAIPVVYLGHYNVPQQDSFNCTASRRPMDGFDVVLLLVVAYVAVMSLVRLMLARRDRLIRELHQQLEVQMRARKRKETQDKAA